MITWLVFNRNMEVIGTVRADSFSEAFRSAVARFNYVDYIQEC